MQIAINTFRTKDSIYTY